MTVCIATIASDFSGQSDEYFIVTASDMAVTTFASSSDKSMVKVEPFHESWAAMISSNDLSECPSILARARENFEGRANTLKVARSCFKRAYQSHVEEMAEDAALRRYGLDMRTFINSGKKRFTEKVFNSLCEKIDAISGSSEFLIYGFDHFKRPHLFCVKDDPYRGITDAVHDKPGFYAIGCGGTAAYGMLSYFGQSVDCSVYRTIFNVCAAKFMAEKVGTIGKETFLYVKKFGHELFGCEGSLVQTIRDQWEYEGKPRIPGGIDKTIEREGCLDWLKASS